jgi:hypothetical protein
LIKVSEVPSSGVANCYCSEMLLYRVVAVASCYVANCYVANCYVASCVVANCVVANCVVASCYVANCMGINEGIVEAA